MGFQPISASTGPGNYNMQLSSFQQSYANQAVPQMSQAQYGQQAMPFQSANPTLNLEIIHMHQLVQMPLTDKCQGCHSQLDNDIGFGCSQCKFYLCQCCYNMVCRGTPNFKLHPAHQLTPKTYCGWTCDGCARFSFITKRFSMKCGICDKDYCLECFFKKKA
jgi:hypothetical protein